MTLFVSDCHLGYSRAKPEKLLKFLQSFPDKNQEDLILVGDIFEKSPHDELTPDVIKLCFFEMCKFKHVTYIPGNHDPKLSKFLIPEDLHIFHIVDSMIYITADGKKYYVCHGDEYDWMVKITHFMSESWFAKKCRTLFCHLHTLTQPHTHFMKELVEAAKWRGCDGVICGHTHDPCIETINGIEYLNCGDWIKSYSAVIEKDGHFKLMEDL